MSHSVSSLSCQRPNPTSAQNRPTSELLCNLCRKPFSTTVYKLSCDCIFCEDCTYSHFNENSNCPSCNRVMGENDFMELVVANPSTTGTDDAKRSFFQMLFTKRSASSPSLCFQDMCAKLLKHNDEVKAEVKFLMKQFLVETNQQAKRYWNIGRAYEALKQESTKLKQALNSQRLEYDNKILGLQNQVQLTGRKLEEKEKMLAQFRKLHTNATVQPSPNRSSTRNSMGGTHNVRPSQPMQPPLKGFIKQKEANERARQQAFEQGRNTSNVFGGLQSRSDRSCSIDGNGQNHITPIHLPKQPQSADGAGSVSMTPRIRDLSSSSGYSFTSEHVNKRRRPGNSPSPIHHGKTPSIAFGYNQSHNFRRENPF